MNQPSDNNDDLRKRIIGHGKHSFQKSYFPELQKRIADLSLYEQVFEQIQDVVLVIDVRTLRVMFVNKAFEKVFHKTKEDIAGSSVKMVMPEKTVESIHKLLRYTDDEFPVYIEEVQEDQDIRYLETRLSIVEVNDELLVVAVLRNVSERVRVAQELEKHRNNLEHLVEERTDEIRQMNAELVATNEELNSANLSLEKEINYRLLAEHKLHEYKKHLEELIEERTKDLLTAKEKAEESDRLKSSFLANISHEIRTPLNAIIGFSSLVTSTDMTNDQKEEYQNIIARSGKDLTNLIDDIMDLSQIELNQLKISKSEFNLHELMDELFLSFQEQKRKNPNLHFDFRLSYPKSKTIMLNSDRYRIRQILMNFISNAFKFTTQGYVEFGYELGGDDSVQLYVKDTGIGIAKNHQDKIFQQFYKIEDDNTYLYRGTGLGLSISKQLADLLGGTIWVDSTLGMGSSFYLQIKLDRVQEIHEESVSKTADKVSLEKYSGKHVLIVEDEINNYMYLEAVLDPYKFEIVHAESGEVAVEKMKKENKFELVFMDIKMPGIDGFEAFSIIRGMNKDIPVIAQTAYAMEDDIDRIEEAGFTAYLTKPILRTAIYEVIQKYIVVQ